jgi:hypothetical protein
VPAVTGVLIDAFGAGVLAPCLMALAVATTAMYLVATRRRAVAVVEPGV